jgi:hypothetical protein
LAKTKIGDIATWLADQNVAAIDQAFVSLLVDAVAERLHRAIRNGPFPTKVTDRTAFLRERRNSYFDALQPELRSFRRSSAFIGGSLQAESRGGFDWRAEWVKSAISARTWKCLWGNDLRIFRKKSNPPAL